MKAKLPPKQIAAAITGLLVLWMLTGIVSGKDAPKADSAAKAEKSLFPVRAVRLESRLITKTSSVNARTEADRSVTLRAEVTGQVVAIGAERGARVAEGDLIVSVEARDRASRAAEAKATLREREMELESTKALAAKGLAAQSQLALAESAAESARAALTSAELDFARSSIRAPFDGVLVDRTVEAGDLLSPGGEVAVVADLDPIVVAGWMTEKEVAGVLPGTGATAKLSDGREISGTITYLSPQADPVTRMYKVELRAPNADYSIRSGLTAVLSVPHEKVMAALVSPASVLLSDEGVVGLLLADEEGVTRFCPVEIAQSAPEGFWVTGAPEKTILVTLGKDFVRPGQKVKLVFEDATTNANR
jgi:multidrug efflux system membrane fusion protein